MREIKLKFGQYCLNKFEPEDLLKSFEITIKEKNPNNAECKTTENSLQTDNMTITWNKNSNFGQKTMIIPQSKYPVLH